jgi:hypothetical protein
MHGSELPTLEEQIARTLPRLADHFDWPDGALAACKALAKRHPAWFVYYSPASQRLPAGYRAYLRQPTTNDPQTVTLTSPQALALALPAERQRLMRLGLWPGDHPSP